MFSNPTESGTQPDGNSHSASVATCLRVFGRVCIPLLLAVAAGWIMQRQHVADPLIVSVPVLAFVVLSVTGLAGLLKHRRLLQQPESGQEGCEELLRYPGRTVVCVVDLLVIATVSVGLYGSQFISDISPRLTIPGERLLAFTPDSQRIITGPSETSRGHEDATLRVRNALTGAIELELNHVDLSDSAFGNPFWADTALSPNGRFLLTAPGRDARNRSTPLRRHPLLWDLESRNSRELEDCSYSRDATRFSPDGRLLAIHGWRNGKDGCVLIDLADFSEQRFVEGSRTPFVFSPDSRFLAAVGDLPGAPADGSYDSRRSHRQIAIIDAAAGEQIAVLRHKESTIGTMAFSADSQSLISVGDRGYRSDGSKAVAECHLWNLQDPGRHQQVDLSDIRNTLGECTAASVLIDNGNVFAMTESVQFTAHLIDMSQSLPVLVFEPERVYHFPFSLSDELLIAEDGSSVRLKKGTFQILETRSGELVSTLSVDESPFRPSFLLLPGGRLVAVRSRYPDDHRRLVVCETSTGRQRCSIALLPGARNSVIERSSPDARTLALSPLVLAPDDETADWHRTLRLYDIPATPVHPLDRVVAWSLATILMCYGLMRYRRARRDLRMGRVPIIRQSRHGSLE